MTIKFTPRAQTDAPSKLADAELVFDDDGALAGLTLVGFAIWRRQNGHGLNVTMPSRAYAAHGRVRSFALLRSVNGPAALERVRDLILEAYAAFEKNTPSA